MIETTTRLIPQSPLPTSNNTLTVELLSVHGGEDGLGNPLDQMNRLVQNRLSLIRRGLREAHRQAADGRTDDAVLLVERLEEDLKMLQGRLNRECAGA